MEPGGRVWEMSVCVCVCVCVCLSEEKRKKVKGRKGMAGQKREKRWCENEQWGMVGRWGARVNVNKNLTMPFFFFFFFFNCKRWDVIGKTHMKVQLV